MVGTSGCYDYGAVAGRAGAALVLTLTETETDRFCVAYVGSATAQVVVHQVPRGQYEVVLQLRRVPRTGPVSAPIDLARGAVTVP
jgi:hypothetical protein